MGFEMGRLMIVRGMAILYVCARYVLLMGAIALPSVAHSLPKVVLNSPDSMITVTVDFDASRRLRYAVHHNGKIMLEPSPLGVTVDGRDLGTAVVSVEQAGTAEVDETYATVGAHAQARNHHLATSVMVSREALIDPSVELQWRVFNDGVAYRYVIPGAGARTVSGEASAWVIPAGTRLWYQRNTTNYENLYFNNLVGEIVDDMGPPVTAKLPDGGGFLTLSEAGPGIYSGMTLRADAPERALRSAFLDDTTWAINGGDASPWRMLVVAADLNTLINSDMVENLNEPHDPALFPAGHATPWIRPGRALWSWWSNPVSGFYYDIQRSYVDAATRTGMDYVLVDVWWEYGFPDNGLDQFGRLALLVQQARAGGGNVGIWVWKDFFELVDPSAREAFFAKVKGAGAVGVKVDNIEGARGDAASAGYVREQISIDAARHQLMLNFHGVPKPTGNRRTYPHIVAFESLAGLELNGLAWDKSWFVPPWHNAALPFTRFVLGPADYTPVTFDPRKIGATTFAHQLATAGLFHSSVMHYAEDAALLEAQTDALDVLRDLPTEWDESIVLAPSAIGEIVLMARRKGAVWYLFAINGSDSEWRMLPKVRLDFLGANTYRAVLIGDRERTRLQRVDMPGFTAAIPLDIGLMPGGGFVARFTPQPSGRTFRMGSVSIPSINNGFGLRQLYEHLATRADLVVHSFQEGVPWVEALHSSNIGDYGAHLLTRVRELKFLTESATPAHDIYLMVNPIDVAYDRKAPYWGVNNNMALPLPWDTLPFDHPDVARAYINYLIALIESFHPKYLAINIEANILLAKEPGQWQAFKAFNANVYRQIKLRYPDLLVFSTIQYEHMLALHSASATFNDLVRDFYPDALTAEVKALFRDSDVVGISTYPYMVVNNPYVVGGTTVVRPDYFDPIFAVASELGLPIAFEQTGYTTAKFDYAPGVQVVGNEQTQLKFIRFLLEKSVEHDAVLFGHFVAYDYGTNYGSDAVSLTWANAGLHRLDGTAKPVLDVWQNYFNLPFKTASEAN